MFVEISGYLGAILLAIWPVQQLIRSVKDGHANGIEMVSLIKLIFGLAFSFIYAVALMKPALILNFGFGLILQLIILSIKIKGEKR